jgi:hypothetical protein
MATGAKIVFPRVLQWKRWRAVVACVSIYVLALNAFLGTALVTRIAASDAGQPQQAINWKLSLCSTSSSKASDPGTIDLDSSRRAAHPVSCDCCLPLVQGFTPPPATALIAPDFQVGNHFPHGQHAVPTVRFAHSLGARGPPTS